jgi:hypothetical protein
MIEGGSVEYKKRGSAQTSNWKLDEAADKLAAILSGAVALVA